MLDGGGKKQDEKDFLAGKILHFNYQPRVSWPYQGTKQNRANLHAKADMEPRCLWQKTPILLSPRFVSKLMEPTRSRISARDTFPFG